MQRTLIDQPGLELVVLPPTTFVMGSSKDEGERLSVPPRYARREYPPRVVRIDRPFAVARHLVTRTQFKRFTDETGHQPGHWCEVFCNNEPVFDERFWWQDPGFAQGDDHPVVAISWYDAQMYLSWLGTRLGKTYRLLSDAEFEYAARGGTTTPWFWGDDATAQAHYANGADLSSLDRDDTFSLSQTYGLPVSPAECRSGYCFTSPVGALKPNPFGLYDMIGNVWEWVEDCFDEQIIPTQQQPCTWDDCELRVIRGGSWAMEPIFLRSAARQRDYAWHNDRDIGFRVARDLGPEELMLVS